MKQIDNTFAEYQIMEKTAEQPSPLCYIQRVGRSVFSFFSQYYQSNSQQKVTEIKKKPEETVNKLQSQFDSEYGFILKYGIDTPEHYYRIRSFWIWDQLNQKLSLAEPLHYQQPLKTQS